MGAAGSNSRVHGRFGVIATALLQRIEHMLQICYAKPELQLRLTATFVSRNADMRA